MVVVDSGRANLLMAACVAFLAACGGGGSEDDFEGGPEPTIGLVLNPDLAPDPATQHIHLRSAEGDLSRYIGRWESTCLESDAVLPGFPKSLVNVYHFTDVEGETVRGHIVQWRYIDRQCRTLDRTDKVSGGVALQVLHTFDVAPDARSTFRGTMDAVQIDYGGASFRSYKGLTAIGFSARYKQFVGAFNDGGQRGAALGTHVFTKK